MALLSLGLGVLALTPPAAQAGNHIPFHAAWAAQIELEPLAPPLVSVSGFGEGRASHLGKVSTQSIDEIVNLETGEGVAQYRFTAANGAHVFVTFRFTAIPTSPTTFSVQGVWEITGGTGRFEGASGSGTYSGQIEFNSPFNALGHFEMDGRISSPGSLK